MHYYFYLHICHHDTYVQQYDTNMYFILYN